MKTFFLRKFSKDIDNIDSKTLRQAILEVIVQIEQAEKIADIRQVKKLSGFSSSNYPSITTPQGSNTNSPQCNWG